MSMEGHNGYGRFVAIGAKRMTIRLPGCLCTADPCVCFVPRRGAENVLEAKIAQLTKERDGALIMRDAWQQRHEELKRSKLALRLSELGRLEARVKRYREALQALSDSLSVVGGKFNGFRREPKCMMDYGWPGHIGLEEGDAISLAISQTREALADEPRTGDEGKGA